MGTFRPSPGRLPAVPGHGRELRCSIPAPSSGDGDETPLPAPVAVQQRIFATEVMPAGWRRWAGEEQLSARSRPVPAPLPPGRAAPRSCVPAERPLPFPSRAEAEAAAAACGDGGPRYRAARGGRGVRPRPRPAGGAAATAPGCAGRRQLQPPLFPDLQGPAAGEKSPLGAAVCAAPVPPGSPVPVCTVPRRPGRAGIWREDGLDREGTKSPGPSGSGSPRRGCSCAPAVLAHGSFCLRLERQRGSN